MNLKLQDRKALVTASSDGIGKGIAKQLSAEGAKVVLSSRSLEKLEIAKKDTGAAAFIDCDLTTIAGVKKLIENHTSQFGIPEILVINTAGPPKGNFSQTTFEDWQRGFEIIWGAPLQLVTWALPAMKEKKWGRIIFSTSLSAKEPISSMVISGALRSGISNLARGLAREVGDSGITVNAVLPGWTNTAAVKKMGAAIEPILAQIPLKRLAEPEEIGNLVTFLASQQASYITGQAIAVDGGILHGV